MWKDLQRDLKSSPTNSPTSTPNYQKPSPFFLQISDSDPSFLKVQLTDLNQTYANPTFIFLITKLLFLIFMGSFLDFFYFTIISLQDIWSTMQIQVNLHRECSLIEGISSFQSIFFIKMCSVRRNIMSAQCEECSRIGMMKYRVGRVPIGRVLGKKLKGK